MTKRKNKNKKEEQPLMSDEVEVETFYIDATIKTKQFYIDNGVKKTLYKLQRWKYGDDLKAMMASAKPTRGMETNFDIVEYYLTMILGTVRSPKLTRQKILDFDPSEGRLLFTECFKLNNPSEDFQDILAGLRKRLPED